MIASNKDVDTHRNIHLLSAGSNVVVKREDRGMWTHGAGKR